MLVLVLARMTTEIVEPTMPMLPQWTLSLPLPPRSQQQKRGLKIALSRPLLPPLLLELVAGVSTPFPLEPQFVAGEEKEGQMPPPPARTPLLVCFPGPRGSPVSFSPC